MTRYFILRNKIQQTLDDQKTPQRVYPDGEAIPDSLPESYSLSQNCGNCGAYVALTKKCSTYDAPVLTNYWCNTWKEK